MALSFFLVNMTHPATMFGQEHAEIVEFYRPTFEQVAWTTTTDVEKTQRSSTHLALSLPHRSSLASPVVWVQLQSMTTDKDRARDLLSSHSTRYQAMGVLPPLSNRSTSSGQLWSKFDILSVNCPSQWVSPYGS